MSRSLLSLLFLVSIIHGRAQKSSVDPPKPVALPEGPKFSMQGLCYDKYFFYNNTTNRCDERVVGGSPEARAEFAVASADDAAKPAEVTKDTPVIPATTAKTPDSPKQPQTPKATSETKKPDAPKTPDPAPKTPEAAPKLPDGTKSAVPIAPPPKENPPASSNSDDDVNGNEQGAGNLLHEFGENLRDARGTTIAAPQLFETASKSSKKTPPKRGPNIDEDLTSNEQGVGNLLYEFGGNTARDASTTKQQTKSSGMTSVPIHTPVELTATKVQRVCSVYAGKWEITDTNSSEIMNSYFDLQSVAFSRQLRDIATVVEDNANDLSDTNNFDPQSSTSIQYSNSRIEEKNSPSVVQYDEENSNEQSLPTNSEIQFLTSPMTTSYGESTLTPSEAHTAVEFSDSHSDFLTPKNSFEYIGSTSEFQHPTESTFQPLSSSVQASEGTNAVSDSFHDLQSEELTSLTPETSVNFNLNYLTTSTEPILTSENLSKATKGTRIDVFTQPPTFPLSFEFTKKSISPISKSDVDVQHLTSSLTSTMVPPLKFSSIKPFSVTKITRKPMKISTFNPSVKTNLIESSKFTKSTRNPFNKSTYIPNVKTFSTIKPFSFSKNTRKALKTSTSTPKVATTESLIFNKITQNLGKGSPITSPTNQIIALSSSTRVPLVSPVAGRSQPISKLSTLNPWSKTSFTRPQNSSTTKSAAVTQAREIEVFEEMCVDCNDTPPISAKECSAKPGAFVNLCGECVGGSTGLPADQGLNACGVCGQQDLISCGSECDGDPGRTRDRCGRCLPRNDLSRDRCVSVTSAVPSILDRCVDAAAALSLTGAGLNSQSAAGVKCTLRREVNDTGGLEVTRVSAREGSLIADLRVPGPGRYRVQCEDNTGAPLPLPQGPSLAVVDSGQLTVVAVSPAETRVGIETQLRATVRQVTPKQMLLCALWSQNPDTLVHVVPASVTSASLVTCGRFEPLAAGRLVLRVTASESAAFAGTKCAGTSEVLVRADAPVLLEALLSPDLRALYFEFEHSVSGPTQCATLFSPSSLTLLGQGSRCRFTGSRLEVLLGERHEVRPDIKIQILVGSGIRRAGTLNSDMAEPLPGLFVTVVLHPSALTTPRYRVIPPPPACEGSGIDSREIRVLAEDGRRLNVSVQVAFTGSPPVDQRRNMLLWRSMRDLGISIEASLQAGRFTVNNSQLLSDVEYRLTVSATDILGSRGEEREVLVRSAADPGAKPATSLLVLGPGSVRPDVELRAEALLLSCDPRLQASARIEYVWSVITAGGPLPLEAPQGRVLRLKPFSVKGGVAHQLACTAYLAGDRTKPLATGTLVTVAMSLGLRAHVAVAGLTIGTGQPLELDASGSRDLDGVPGPLQFSWSCEREGVPCTLPNAGTAIPLSSSYQSELTQPILKLPAKILAVGDHVFTVRVSRSSGGPSSSAVARVGVRIVRGAPPALRLAARPMPALPVDPAVGVTLAARLESMRGRCWARWRSLVRRPGDATLPLQSAAMSLWEDEPAKDFPLVLAPVQLVAGARHRLQLEAACSVLPSRLALQRSALEVEISVATPPQPAVLQVTPAAGQALRTVFFLRVDSAGAAAEPGSGPLLYEFGWREAGKTRVQPLYSTLYDLAFSAVFPCDGGVSECSLVPVVRVCDGRSVCVTSEATPLKVAMPAALTNDDVSEIAGRVDTLLGARQFKAALALAQGALRTAGSLENADQRTAELTEHVEAALLATIEDLSARMQSSRPALREALRLLGDEGSEWRDPSPSPRVLNALAALKQKVVSTLSGKDSRARPEPRRVLGNGPLLSIPSPRKKRQLLSETPTILSTAEVESLLRVSEHLILDPAISADVAKAERERMRSDLQEYVRGLCAGLTSSMSRRGVEVRSKVASLAVAAVSGRRSELYLPALKSNDQDFAEDVAYVQVLDAGSAQCLAATNIISNMEGASANSTWENLHRLEKSVEVKLLGTGASQSISKIFLRLRVTKSDLILPVNHDVKCARWDEGRWDIDSCTTTVNLPHVKCSCRAFGGQFSTILVEKATIPPPVTAANKVPMSITPTNVTQMVTTAVISESDSAANGLANEVTSHHSDTTVTEPDAEWINVPEKTTQKLAIRPILPTNPDSEWIVTEPKTTTQSFTRDPPKHAELNPTKSTPEDNTLKYGRITTHVITFTVADVTVPPSRLVELEQRLKKQIAQQAYLPESAIPDVTYDKGSMTVRLEFNREERLKRGVMELTRLLRFGRLELRGLEGERLRVPAQMIQGLPGVPEFPAGPGPEFPDEADVATRSTGAPPVITTTTKPVVPPVAGGKPPSDVTTLPPAFPEAPRPLPPGVTTPRPRPDSDPTAPPGGGDSDVDYTDLDTNAEVKEDPTLVAIVFAGAALMLMILFVGAIRAFFIMRTTESSWEQISGDHNDQLSPAGSKQPVVKTVSNEMTRKYRQIQHPAEILAALAQFSHPPYSPSLSPVDAGERWVNPHGHENAGHLLVPAHVVKSPRTPVKSPLTSQHENSKKSETESGKQSQNENAGNRSQNGIIKLSQNENVGNRSQNGIIKSSQNENVGNRSQNGIIKSSQNENVGNRSQNEIIKLSQNENSNHSQKEVRSSPPKEILEKQPAGGVLSQQQNQNLLHPPSMQNSIGDLRNGYINIAMAQQQNKQNLQPPSRANIVRHKYINHIDFSVAPK